MTLDNYNIFNDEYLFGMPLSPLPKVVRDYYCYSKPIRRPRPLAYLDPSVISGKEGEGVFALKFLEFHTAYIHMLLPLVLDCAWLVAFAYRCQLNSWKLEIPLLVFYAFQCAYYTYNVHVCTIQFALRPYSGSVCVCSAAISDGARPFAVYS